MLGSTIWLRKCKNGRPNFTNDGMTIRWGAPSWSWVTMYLLWLKGFWAKYNIVDCWENTTYKIIKKLTNVPIYKISMNCPKLGEGLWWVPSLVHHSDAPEYMLFLLAWFRDWYSQRTETVIKVLPMTTRLAHYRVKLSKKWHPAWKCWCTTSGAGLWECHTPSWVGGDSFYLVRAQPPKLDSNRGKDQKPAKHIIEDTSQSELLCLVQRENVGGREVCHWPWPLCKLCLLHSVGIGYKIFHIPKIHVMHGGLSVLQHVNCITR